MRHAAVDLAPYNVRVNAIAPGPFLTNIAGGRLHREPDAIKKFIAMVPMGRIAQPDEIKGLALAARLAGGELHHRHGDPDRRRHDGEVTGASHHQRDLAEVLVRPHVRLRGDALVEREGAVDRQLAACRPSTASHRSARISRTISRTSSSERVRNVTPM